MPSSPARRRQSTRTPQRRPERSKAGQTDNLDPFVSPQKGQGDADMLRQSLLAQLTARVEAEPATSKNTSWRAGGETGRHATTATTDHSYEDKHKRLFNSMASIGHSLAKSVWRPSAVNSGPSKRSVDTVTETMHGTPSKRRRLAEVVNPPATPALSFHFDGGSDRHEVKTYATPTRIPVAVHTPTQQAQTVQDVISTTTTTPRDAKRREKKTREVLLRKNNKATSASRPGWR